MSEAQREPPETHVLVLLERHRFISAGQVDHVIEKFLCQLQP